MRVSVSCRSRRACPRSRRGRRCRRRRAGMRARAGRHVRLARAGGASRPPSRRCCPPVDAARRIVGGGARRRPRAGRCGRRARTASAGCRTSGPAEDGCALPAARMANDAARRSASARRTRSSPASPRPPRQALLRLVAEVADRVAARRCPGPPPLPAVRAGDEPVVRGGDVPVPVERPRHRERLVGRLPRVALARAVLEPARDVEVAAAALAGERHAVHAVGQRACSRRPPGTASAAHDEHGRCAPTPHPDVEAR